MHYYQFNIGDYVSSTQHLDESEDLAYRRMLDVYYSKELPLPESQDEIARLIRMRTHSESIAIVLREFFVLENDGYHCIRADKEISSFQAKSDKARKSAEARWNKNKDLPKNSVDANALRTESEGNAKHKTLNTKQETYIEFFILFWDAYPKKVSKPQAEKAFKKVFKDLKLNKETAIEFIELIRTDCQKRFDKTEKQFIPNASTYLNNDRWNDEY